MDKFLLDLFRTPENQRDPYAWGCVFGSHFAFGMVAWVLFMVITHDPLRATQASIFIYVVWETAQFLMKRTFAIFLDCVLDTIAWASMSLAIYEVWLHEIYNAAAYAFGAMIILMTGIAKRLRP